MYLEHFGLNEKPFNITPNPQYIFLSKNHKEVFAHLLYGLQSRCGFIEITGEVGAGKTTVLRTLFEQLEDNEFRLAFIFNPSLSADELLLEICREFGISTGDCRGGQLLPLINDYLLNENAAGRTVVLVIDEAQNLAAPVLEQIRLLSNLETETDKLIQIVLVGQPELADVLGRTNLRQLNQRISVRYHLMPMDESDTYAYLKHRLKIAGNEERVLFSDAAMKQIYKYSGGLPRLINILADRALLAAFSEDLDMVDRNEVRTAISELRQVGQVNAGKRVLLPVAWGGALLAVLLLAFLSARILLPNNVAALNPSDSRQAEQPPAAHNPSRVDYEYLEQLRSGIAAIGEDASFMQSATGLSRTWHFEPINNIGPDFNSREFISLLKQDGWEWTPYHGDFQSLTSFDTPVLLELVLPGVPGRRYMSLTAISGDEVVVSPPVNNQASIPRQALASLYSGRAYFVWKNYLDIGYFSSLGTASSDVREIQSLLIESGYDQLAPTGIYDDNTLRAVTRFQAEKGIAQDGRVGPLTLLLLYQQSRHFNPPKLISSRRS